MDAGRDRRNAPRMEPVAATAREHAVLRPVDAVERVVELVVVVVVGLDHRPALAVKSIAADGVALAEVDHERGALGDAEVVRAVRQHNRVRRIGRGVSFGRQNAVGDLARIGPAIGMRSDVFEIEAACSEAREPQRFKPRQRVQRDVSVGVQTTSTAVVETAVLIEAAVAGDRDVVLDQIDGRGSRCGVVPGIGIDLLRRLCRPRAVKIGLEAAQEAWDELIAGRRAGDAAQRNPGQRLTAGVHRKKRDDCGDRG